MSTTRSTASARPTAAADPAEAGTAIIGTLVGFLIFLTLMLFAAQVLVRLFAMSAMTSAATKAAETVASAADPQASVPGAQQAAQSQLGSYRVSFDWESIGPDDVVLQVAGRSPGFLPLPSSWTTIRRTVTVHLERFQ